jgi:hypothetical protein
MQQKRGIQHMKARSVAYGAVMMVMMGLQLSNRPGGAAWLRIYDLVADQLRRTEEGARALDDLATSPGEESCRAATQILAHALSADDAVKRRLEEAVSAFVSTPPVSRSHPLAERMTEAQRRKQMLESMELRTDDGRAIMPAISAIAQHFASYYPEPKRDIERIEAVIVDGEYPSATAVMCDDGSSLIVLQSKIIEWLIFQSQLAWLAGAGEAKTGCSSTKSGKLKLQAIFAALVRTRVAHWRFMRMPGSLALLVDEDASPDLAMNGDLYNDSLLFILLHEVAHCVLGHDQEERSLFGWRQPVKVVRLDERIEHEADKLAAVVLLDTALQRAKFVGRTLDHEYYNAWLGSVAAAAAISFWENGVFLRTSHSHPSADERFRRLRDTLSRRWTLTRPLRRMGLDLLVEASGLASVMAGVMPRRPLPKAAWQAAISVPCLTDDERMRLHVAMTFDEVICGGTELAYEHLKSTGALPAAVFPIPARGDSVELDSYLQSIGVSPQHRGHLLDCDVPIMFSTAVDYVASAAAFSSLDPEGMGVQHAVGYRIIMNNMKCLRRSRA